MIDEYSINYTLSQVNRSFLRRAVRRFYLNNIKNLVIGKAIDFGCGAGELLKLLPEGSIGLEVNNYIVSYLKNKGLNVKYYDINDNYSFDFVEEKDRKGVG